MASDKKNQKGKQPAAKPLLRDGPNWPLFSLAVLGMALSAYLSWTAWQGKLAAFCAEGAGCDVVLNSRWSTLLGMPTSLWGFLTYALLAAIAWNRYADNQWRWAWVISLFGLLFSLYLTSISFFELKAACPYCLTSLGIMAVIFITTTLERPENLPKFSWGPWLGKTVSVAAAVIVALHLHYTGYWGDRPGP
ncbi:MAG: vitamin K epoxide reductase family protein, partial [Candidatus Binatia bacterium]